MSVPASWRSHPNFILATVSLCLFTDFFAYGVVLPALPGILEGRLALPDSLVANGNSALLGAYTMAAVLFILPVGRLADRFEMRHRLLLCALAPSGAANLLLACGRTPLAFLASWVLQGVASSVVWTVGFAMLDKSTTPGHRGYAIGTALSLATVGHAIAPILGDELYEHAGPRSVFVVLLVLWLTNLVMRVLVVGPETPARIGNFEPVGDANLPSPATPRESDSLLGRRLRHESPYVVRAKPGDWAHPLPILYCCRLSRVLGALFLSFTQAVLFSLFGTLIRVGAKAQFVTEPLHVNFLFLALFVPAALLGSVVGKETDSLGTRSVATVGYAAFAPCLLLLTLPCVGFFNQTFNLVVFCILLTLNGVCLALITPPSFLEIGQVQAQFNAVNPGFFGPRGACAQMYSLNTLFVFLGSAFGPLVGAPLVHRYGFALMMVGAAILATVGSATAWLVLREQKPQVWRYRGGCRW